MKPSPRVRSSFDVAPITNVLHSLARPSYIVTIETASVKTVGPAPLGAGAGVVTVGDLPRYQVIPLATQHPPTTRAATTPTIAPRFDMS